MVEAMKMEFAIKAEVAGTVKKILVTEGQQLTPGQKLVDFEEKP
jgi:biotin carboxyl carrier protein